MEFRETDTLHFFSYETKISMDLLAGWQEESQSKDTAVYYVDVSEVPAGVDAPSSNPRILVKAIAVGNSTADNHIKLADAILNDSLANVTVIEREEGTLDSQPAVFDLFTFDMDGTRTTQYMAHAQISDVVFSIVCTVEEAYAEVLLPSMQLGVASARFILIAGGGVQS
ncbi:MAG: hypothetical protein AAFV98_00860 [Chloroflexota bacterium]